MTSDEVVADSICSDESVQSFKGSEHTFDCDEALQWDPRMILQEHSNNVIKKWGNSEQWVLELRDGRRVAILI